MKARLLSPVKLEIRLDRHDLDSCGLTFAQLSVIKPYPRSVLKQAFERASRETGFTQDGHRLFIEAFPQNGGGCSLMVTKLPRESPGASGTDGPAPGARYIFAFKSFNDLADAARALRHYWTDGCASAAARLGGRFYLMLSLPQSYPHQALAHNLLCEYAAACPDTELAAAYISEHGDLCLPERAVERLSGRS